jgi:hypothetical protein
MQSIEQATEAKEDLELIVQQETIILEFSQRLGCMEEEICLTKLLLME